MKNIARLFTRMLVVNAIGLAGVFAAWKQGWVQLVWDTDPTGISAGIVVAFLAGVGACMWRAWKISRQMDEAERSPPVLTNRQFEQRRMKLLSRIEFVGQWAVVLSTIGLVGTIVGLLMGTEEARAHPIITDVSGVWPMLVQIFAGIGVSFYTLLVAAIATEWLAINHMMLKTATVTLAATSREPE